MKKSKVVLAGYIVAGVICLLTIYMFASTVATLNQQCAMYGTSIGALGMEAVSIILQSAAPWIVYAALSLGAAKILDVVIEIKDKLNFEEAFGSEESSCEDEEIEFASSTGAAEALKELSEGKPEEDTNVPPIYTSKSIYKY